MPTQKKIPSPPDHSEAWRERIETDLAARTEAGGTLHGQYGAYVKPETG